MLSKSSANKLVATGIFETAKAGYHSFKNPVKTEDKHAKNAKVSSPASTKAVSKKAKPAKSAAVSRTPKSVTIAEKS
ncbi:MAG: hypothetical protein WD425_17795 [Nitrospirales bacterium]